MDAGPRIESYDGAGGREAMLRFGPEDGPVAVVALPLFEEANRTRAVAVALLRALAVRGIAGALPDLPGTGESSIDLADTTLLRMREAHAAAVDQLGARCYAIGIRSGALTDVLGLVRGRWHLAPQQGEPLLREQLRLAQIGGTVRPGSDVHALVQAEAPSIVAGNAISAAMAADLLGATTCDAPGIPRRTVRLDSDPAPADVKLAGAPPWRRAEPGNDPALAARLADDIAAWIARCEG